MRGVSAPVGEGSTDWQTLENNGNTYFSVKTDLRKALIKTAVPGTGETFQLVKHLLYKKT